MNDTQINEHDDAEVDENEILDVTIIDEDAEADEPVAESAFDRPGRWYIVAGSDWRGRHACAVRRRHHAEGTRHT